MTTDPNDSFSFPGDPVGVAAPTAQPFPTLRATIAHRQVVTAGGAVLVLLLGVWLAVRTGFVELYPIAIVTTAVAWFVLRAAVEVIELVAETLMPR